MKTTIVFLIFLFTNHLCYAKYMDRWLDNSVDISELPDNDLCEYRDRDGECVPGLGRGLSDGDAKHLLMELYRSQTLDELDELQNEPCEEGYEKDNLGDCMPIYDTFFD